MSTRSAFNRLRHWLTGQPLPTAEGTPAPSTARPTATHSGLRQQRTGRREQLFALVRENMIRMGVLSSHYKFKVLTLDPAGEQFIVMVDWQPGAQGADPRFERQFESGLQHLLIERHTGFKVKAVYWRGHLENATASGARPLRAAPAGPAPTTANLAQQATQAAARHTADTGEHVSDDEIQALHAALRQAGAPPPPAKPAATRPPALAPEDQIDFAPTVNTSEQGSTDFGSLSETQYGKLQ